MSEAPSHVNGSNLMDVGRGSAWSAVEHGAHLLVGVEDPGPEAPGRAAVAPGRCCRGRAGHRPRRSVDGERGNRPGVASSSLASGGGGRQGPPPADGPGTGRRLRSTPRTGEPSTWGREPAGLQRHGWEGGRR